MKKDNKKALYESIMTSVAKEVKKALNEDNDFDAADQLKKLEQTKNLHDQELNKELINGAVEQIKLILSTRCKKMDGFVQHLNQDQHQLIYAPYTLLEYVEALFNDLNTLVCFDKNFKNGFKDKIFAKKENMYSQLKKIKESLDKFYDNVSKE